MNDGPLKPKHMWGYIEQGKLLVDLEIMGYYLTMQSIMKVSLYSFPCILCWANHPWWDNVDNHT